MLTGAESLTTSERRVCRLASDGLENADIAQALFVSLRTVDDAPGQLVSQSSTSLRAPSRVRRSRRRSVERRSSDTRLLLKLRVDAG
jgi:FixJ family two-component response regulator